MEGVVVLQRSITEVLLVVLRVWQYYGGSSSIVAQHYRGTSSSIEGVVVLWREQCVVAQYYRGASSSIEGVVVLWREQCIVAQYYRGTSSIMEGVVVLQLTGDSNSTVRPVVLLVRLTQVRQEVVLWVIFIVCLF